MESPQNPFAPPSARLEDVSTDRVWRDGKVLVAPLGAALPSRCVKCGEPASEMKPRTYYWHHPALYLLVLCALLIYLLLAIILRRRAILTVGLCETHARKRRNGVLVGWLGTLAGIVMMVAGAANDYCGVAVFGLIFFFGTIVAGMFMARVLYPEHIDRTYARLKGCGEGFLATLPDFHG